VTTRIIMVVAVVLALGATGCDDGFSPKGTIADEPILYCVFQVDATGEYYEITATLTRVYDVEGFDPTTNTVDPTIGRATMSLFNASQWYSLEETLVPRPSGSPYPGCCQIVYRNSKVYVRTRDSLRLEAQLADGRVLSASTVVPVFKPVTTFPLYPRGVTTQLPSLYYGSSWILNWEDYRHEDHLFFPTMQLIYEKTTPSGTEYYSRDVPLRYVRQGGVDIPVYPQVTSARELAFEFSAIDATMRAISEGDPEKARYRTVAFAFELIEFDFALSRYYASVNGSLDQVSVRLDETVFTNITNGRGVFGTSLANTTYYYVNDHYAALFGYSSVLP
jgi:hypothetical protein